MNYCEESALDALQKEREKFQKEISIAHDEAQKARIELEQFQKEYHKLKIENEYLRGIYDAISLISGNKGINMP